MIMTKIGTIILLKFNYNIKRVIKENLQYKNKNHFQVNRVDFQ